MELEKEIVVAALSQTFCKVRSFMSPFIVPATMLLLFLLFLGLHWYFPTLCKDVQWVQIIYELFCILKFMQGNSSLNQKVQI